jgi:hypothetical protein
MEVDDAQNTEDKRKKIHALSLAKECYSMKLDLLLIVTLVDDAIPVVLYEQTISQLILHLPPMQHV